MSTIAHTITYVPVRPFSARVGREEQAVEAEVDGWELRMELAELSRKIGHNS